MNNHQHREPDRPQEIRYGDVSSWARASVKPVRPLCAGKTIRPKRKVDISAITAIAVADSVVPQPSGITYAKLSGSHEPEIGSGGVSKIIDAKLSASEYVNRILGLK